VDEAFPAGEEAHEEPAPQEEIVEPRLAEGIVDPGELGLAVAPHVVAVAGDVPGYTAVAVACERPVEQLVVEEVVCGFLEQEPRLTVVELASLPASQQMDCPPKHSALHQRCLHFQRDPSYLAWQRSDPLELVAGRRLPGQKDRRYFLARQLQRDCSSQENPVRLRKRGVPAQGLELPVSDAAGSRPYGWS
jgi:hypothetical protein